MGMSTVITQVILFIAVLGIVSGLLVSIKNYTDKTEGAFSQKSAEYNNVIKTNIKIDVISHDNNTDTTWIYVRNTGQTNMKPEHIDVYIDGIRFPRNDSNRTIEVLWDTEIEDIGIWNPKEELLIKAFMELNENISHNVIVTTPYEVRDTDSFSI